MIFHRVSSTEADKLTYQSSYNIYRVFTGFILHSKASISSHHAAEMCQGWFAELLHMQASAGSGLVQEAPAHNNHPSTTIPPKHHAHDFSHQTLLLFSAQHWKARWSLGMRLATYYLLSNTLDDALALAIPTKLIRLPILSLTWLAMSNILSRRSLIW